MTATVLVSGCTGGGHTSPSRAVRTGGGRNSPVVQLRPATRPTGAQLRYGTTIGADRHRPALDHDDIGLVGDSWDAPATPFDIPVSSDLSMSIQLAGQAALSSHARYALDGPLGVAFAGGSSIGVPGMHVGPFVGITASLAFDKDGDQSLPEDLQCHVDHVVRWTEMAVHHPGSTAGQTMSATLIATGPCSAVRRTGSSRYVGRCARDPRAAVSSTRRPMANLR